MKFARLACCMLSGLMLAAGGANAQEAADRPTYKETPAKKPSGKKSAARKTTGSKAAALQAQREAEARAQAELEARLLAEAEARKQAGAEAKKKAELEAREKPLRDAEEMMKNSKPADAYALLEPLEFDRSGEVRFDYLLGIAALDSGKPDKATLAFERVLAVDPNFAGARLDMARAYYQLGDLPRAKTEFEEVMKQNPPEAARITIQKYLDAIAAYEQAKQTRITGYAEGVVGHDSNIANSSTQSFTPSGTYLAGITFPPAAKLTGSYEGVNAGAEIVHSLNNEWGVFAGGDLRQHGNMVQTAYDTTSIDGRAGVAYGAKEDVYRLTLTGGQLYSANSMRRDSLGISGEWQHIFSPTDQMSIFVQYGQNRASGFPATSPTTDARIEGDTDLFVFGEGWVHVMNDGKQALFGSLYAGEEWDVAPIIPIGGGAPPAGHPLANGGRTDGKKKFGGFRVGMQSSFTDDLDGLASFGWQSAGYQRVNNLTMANRSEKIYDLTVAANWRLDKLWSVKPQVAFSRKNSNISLYSFDRTDISLTIRRDFR